MSKTNKFIILIITIFFLAIFISCKEEKSELLLLKESYSLVEGESVKIEYEIKNKKDDDKVTIKSLNESIALIQDEYIIAQKEGTCEIELSLTSTNDKKTIMVTVSKKIEETKEELIINQEEYTLEIGDSISLDYETKNLKDDTNVIIESSNEEIVSIEINSINNNIIIANNAGTATITIYLSSDMLKKTITVTVNEPPKPSISIANKGEKVSLYGFLTLICDIDNASNDDFIIESSDESIIKITDDGLLEGISLGKAIIKVTLKENTEVTCEAEFEVTVDPMIIMDKLNITDVLVKDVVTFGENPKERHQTVLGSVLRYSFNELNIISQIAPIDENQYTGQVATEEMLETVEPMKLVRPGIYLEELKYIIYHDTGNINAGANAKMHADYMVSSGNRNLRARSWHYTVDEDGIYQQVPDNEITWQGDSYDAYAKSIGIETCVNYGSDLYRVWLNAAKLMASLIEKYGLSIECIKQHYEMSGKNCPQTLRENNLYSYAISLIEGEILFNTYLKDYDVTFTSLSPEYLDDTGKVIKQPTKTTRLAYKIEITGKGYSESKIYYSVITGTEDSSPLKATTEELQFASDFDKKVINLNDNVTLDDEQKIEELVNKFYSFNENIQSLICTKELLFKKEEELFELFNIKTNILINEVFTGKFDDKGYYHYIELYNTTAENIDLSNYILKINDQEYIIEKGIIKSQGYYLIALKDYFNGNSIDLPLPDYVIDCNIEADYTISLIFNNTIIDKLGVGNSESEGTAVIYDLNKEMSFSISRKNEIDTNDNARDFIINNLTPTNSDYETSLSAKTENEISAYVLDYQSIFYSKEINSDNYDEIYGFIEEYKQISNDIKEQTQKSKLTKQIETNLIGFKNPDMKILYDLISQIPEQIVDDYTFPTYEGVTYAYASGEDSSYFDLANGKYLKTSYEYKLIKLVASLNESKVEFEINFGVANENDTIIYYTGESKPSSGKTCDGNGTYNTQLSTTGFGGVAIRVDNKLFFIGKDSLINLSAPKNGTLLTKEELRPLKNDTTINNLGIVLGAGKAYKGAGALYYNSTAEPLKFDLSDTYGRNNNGSYGYAKIIFAINEKGDYVVSQILPDTGTNDSTTNYILTLNPGEYLWCPHTYDTREETGTWLSYPGASTNSGILTLGKELEIIYYARR